jgi:hypothetical protein
VLLWQSTAAIAAAEKLGDFFQSVVEKPVTLRRQKSAFLPIVGKGVAAGRVSIYNEGTQPKFPLLGLRLKNTSGLHLMQVPVTVFEGGSYAGDARIMDLQPNEERLLSYAVDLGTEVKPEVAADSGRLTQVKVVKGVLHTITKLRETKTYAVKNRNPQDRTVLIEHPVRDQFKHAAGRARRGNAGSPLTPSEGQDVSKRRTRRVSLAEAMRSLLDGRHLVFLCFLPGRVAALGKALVVPRAVAVAGRVLLAGRALEHGGARPALRNLVAQRQLAGEYGPSLSIRSKVWQGDGRGPMSARKARKDFSQRSQTLMPRPP